MYRLTVRSEAFIFQGRLRKVQGEICFSFPLPRGKRASLITSKSSPIRGEVLGGNLKGKEDGKCFFLAS